jgi:hypothetical protein
MGRLDHLSAVAYFKEKKGQQPLKPEAALPVDIVIGIDVAHRN